MIQDKDNGYAALFKRLEDLESDPPRVLVGVLDAEQHRDSDLTVADVAAFHEFGLGVPRRSFIGDWFDLNQAQCQEWAAKGLQGYIKGTLTREKMISQLGARMV